MPPETQPDPNEEFWREYLTRGDSLERRLRILFKHLPSDPRCSLCAAPFSAPGSVAMRLIGKRPAPQSPNVCGQCYANIANHHGGAEIEVTLLFADIRGSTTLAEGMSARDFRSLLDRFYTVASRVVFDHDGTIDKFVGDELVAYFVPLFSGPDHATKALEAARDLLRATGHAEPAGPWVPVGAGLHAGVTWYGAVGQGDRTELTAVGDAVNTTARLASLAAAGEILVTTAAAAAAGLDPGLERRTLELKGKQQTIDVVSIRVQAPTAGTAA